MDTRNSSPIVLAAALGCLSICGCEAATNAANGVGKFAENTARNIELGTNDAAITLAIKGELASEQRVKAANIHVTTVRGVVTLKGMQPSDDARSRAEEIARKPKGVVDVVNEIVVVRME